MRASGVNTKTDFIYCYINNTEKEKHAKVAKVFLTQGWERRGQRQRAWMRCNGGSCIGTFWINVEVMFCRFIYREGREARVEQAVERTWHEKVGLSCNTVFFLQMIKLSLYK